LNTFPLVKELELPTAYVSTQRADNVFNMILQRKCIYKEE